MEKVFWNGCHPKGTVRGNRNRSPVFLCERNLSFFFFFFNHSCSQGARLLINTHLRAECNPFLETSEGGHYLYPLCLLCSSVSISQRGAFIHIWWPDFYTWSQGSYGCQEDIHWSPGSGGQGAFHSLVPRNYNNRRDSSWQAAHPEHTADWHTSPVFLAYLPICLCWSFGSSGRLHVWHTQGPMEVLSGKTGWWTPALRSPSASLQLAISQEKLIRWSGAWIFVTAVQRTPPDHLDLAGSQRGLCCSPTGLYIFV